MESCLKTLQETKTLLSNLSNDDYTNKTVAPYYSSVGSHVRHILDFYDCITNETSNEVNLINRSRDLEMESSSISALAYLNTLVSKLNTINQDQDRRIVVIDDLGQGAVKINYTFGALMAQANSHTIHHHAIINYILSQLNVNLSEDRFGFNPSTPEQKTY